MYKKFIPLRSASDADIIIQASESAVLEGCVLRGSIGIIGCSMFTHAHPKSSLPVGGVVMEPLL